MRIRYMAAPPMFHSLVVVLLAVIVAGCGRSQESAVRGTVTFDGKPLPRGTVSFHPTQTGAVAYGTIQPDGSYKVCTGASRGLAAGDYTVTVEATEPMTHELAAKLAVPPSIIPLRYGNAKTADLRCTVKPGENQFDWELKP